MNLFVMTNFLRYISLFIALISICASAGAKGYVSFSGARLEVQSVTPDRSTGLDRVYVAYDMQGLAIVYHASSDNDVKWYKYSNLGGGYAQEISGISRSGREYTLSAPEGEMGYIIEEGSDKYYFWLVNYSLHRLQLRGLVPAPEQDCAMTHLIVSGAGSPIHFVSINGRQFTLDQQIELSYYTLEYSEEDRQFTQVSTTQNLESFSENVYVNPAPLCNTTFHMSGDRFLRAWNWLQEAESDNFNTNAVEVHTYAEQAPESDDPDYISNQIGSGTSSGELGGSAPADITFSAIVSDAVIHHEWQFASDPDFENLLYRFNEQDVNYVFREEGTTYVRYIGSNSDGSCEAESDVYTVNIGASDLKVPNAFSPGTSEGVNDVWKVSYRSIIDFKCWIFNRHGRQLYHFTDPADGWDGKVGGKVVKSGVYYYVIEATGADGKHYKLSGDINIIGFKGLSGSSSGDSEPSDTDTE